MRERIRLDDTDIDWPTFDRLAERVLAAAESLDATVSFFEALTALAFLAFADAGVHTQVLEVGVGGGSDATRAATPTHVAITHLALDHAALIGPTLADIAREKFGATAPGSLNVLAIPPRFHAGAPPGWFFGRELRATASTALNVVTPDRALTLPLPRLVGAHQVRNAAVAAALCVRLELPTAAIAAGIERVRWRARLERLDGPVPTWLDGAHNPDGVRRLIASFPLIGLAPGFTLVFGAHPKKDAGPMLRRLAHTAGHVVLTSAPLLRDPRRLARALPGRSHVHVEPDPGAAVALGRSFGAPVLIAGSLYLAGAVLGALEGGADPA